MNAPCNLPKIQMVKQVGRVQWIVEIQTIELRKKILHKKKEVRGSDENKTCENVTTNHERNY